MNKTILVAIVFIELFYISSPMAEIGKLMLTVEQRKSINAFRNAKNPNLTATNPVVAVKPHLKNISVSSVIINEKNQKVVRVNGQYRKEYLKNVKIDAKATTVSEVKFIVDGKSVQVPVGKTYLTKSQKLTSNHAQEEKVTRIKLKLATEKQKKQKNSAEINKKQKEMIKKLIGG